MIPNTGPGPILVLPALLQDIINSADKWGKGGNSGRIDPFADVYDVSLSRTMDFGIGAEFASSSSFLS